MHTKGIRRDGNKADLRHVELYPYLYPFSKIISTSVPILIGC